MNIESTFTVLRREQLLIDQSPHSVQFEHLTERLLRAFSAATLIPPLTAKEIHLYAALALLHDVGKRAIPQEILNKPGQLTQEEFSIMKSHTTQGCDLLERIPELRECEVFPLICDVCRHHHERWDGNGYIHPRVYKPAYPKEQASDMILSGACGIFNPLLLACFARHIGEISQTVYSSAG